MLKILIYFLRDNLFYVGHSLTNTRLRGVADRVMPDSGASREEDGEEKYRDPLNFPFPLGDAMRKAREAMLRAAQGPLVEPTID